MTCKWLASSWFSHLWVFCYGDSTYILVLEMLQQLQLSVGSLGQNRCAERLHDLFDCDIGTSEVVFGRATQTARISILLGNDGYFTSQLRDSSWRCWKERKKRTKRDQMRPCQPAGDQSTYITGISVFMVAEREVWNFSTFAPRTWK